MNTWKNMTPHARRIILTYLLIGIPCMLAAMLGFAVGYGRLFSLRPDDPLSWLHLVGFTLAMVVAILVGLAIGGWIWLPLARFLCRFSRFDIEELLAHDRKLPLVSRYNNWCLDVVFGSAKKRGSDAKSKHGVGL
jgi:hypothetical protein